MVRRDHEHEPIDTKRQDLEPGHLDRAGDDPDIGTAVGDGPDDLVTEPLLQVDIDLGIGREKGAERLGQKLGQRIGIRHQPYLPAQTIGILGQITAHPFGLLQQ